MTKFTKDGALAMLQKISDDEPVFVLRAQDQAAVTAIQAWIIEAQMIGASKEKCEGAREDLQAFFDWQKTHHTKVPD